MNEASLMLIEQNFWELIDQVYLDLDWIQTSLEFCTSLGPLPGELGSIEGDFGSDWEEF